VGLACLSSSILLCATSLSFGKMLGIIVEGPVSPVSLKVTMDRGLEENQVAFLGMLREGEVGGEGFI